MTVTQEQLDKVQKVIDNCAQAMFDDREFNAGPNGVNAHEASWALDVVAEILGLRPSHALLDDLYNDAWEEPF